MSRRVATAEYVGQILHRTPGAGERHRAGHDVARRRGDGQPAGRAVPADHAADDPGHGELSRRECEDAGRDRRRCRSSSRSTASRTCSTCSRPAHPTAITRSRSRSRSARTSTSPRCWCRTAFPPRCAQLPQAVQPQGVVTKKKSTAILQIITLTSPTDRVRRALPEQFRHASVARQTGPSRRRRRT